MNKSLLLGAIAGGLGSIAIKAFVRFVDPSSFGLNACTDARAAQAIWQHTGRGPLAKPRAENVGALMHYGFGIITGSLYTKAALHFPVIRSGRGAAFGAALWLAGDEMAVSAAGLEDPFKTRAASHLSALAAHVLYGLIVDACYCAPRS